MKVPLLDLKLQYQRIRREIVSAVHEVLESQQFILGPTLEDFEKEMVRYLQIDHAIGVSSGTDALFISLMALEVGRDDAVITTPFTFFSTVSSITRVGATPLFVDIDPLTFTISPEKTKETVSSLRGNKRNKLKAVIPVHLYGQCADMDSLTMITHKYHLKIVEDAAQALGARYLSRGSSHFAGCGGDFGCFSFFPTKNLGGYGEGGMVVTHDKGMAERVRSLRHHGSRSQQEQYYYDLIGINGRLDALQSAVLRVKLKYLEQWTSARRLNAERYNKMFKETGLVTDRDTRVGKGKPIALPYVREGNYHVFNQYVIRAYERNSLKEFLTQQGIGCGIYYPLPIHLQSCYKGLGYKKGSFPEAERAAKEVLALPVYPELTIEQQELVVSTVERFYKDKK